MMKKNKKDKQTPNIIVFLVEGESDKIVLELPIANLILDKHPDFEVRFLLQERLVNKTGNEVEDIDDDEDDDIIPENEYISGGDITTSSYVTPKNIEAKIFHRFIRPSVLRDGIYPRRIAKIIHIVDLDGAYISDENIVPYTHDHEDYDELFYDGENGLIETSNINNIVLRNSQKRENINYLLGLPDGKIKIKSKKIPYEIYFFSSNMDHYVNNDANVKEGKKHLARKFLRSYGLDTDDFCSFFFNDPASIGHMGYFESWDYVKGGINSARRFTNIDCLIRRLMEE